MQIRKITSSDLKIISLIVMIIDHMGATIFFEKHKTEMLLFFQHIFPSLTVNTLYNALRIIGRTGWPIFCFFLIEGVKHTKNRNTYFFRTFLFGCISQFPYNLARKGSFLSYDGPNIMFTLALGMIMLFIFEDLKERYCGEQYLIGIYILIAFIFGMCAEYFHFDYGIMGICMMFIFYFFYDYKPLYLIITLFYRFPSRWIASVISIILINMYNGKKGKLNSKWFFYIFYPTHLLLLGLI